MRIATFHLSAAHGAAAGMEPASTESTGIGLPEKSAGIGLPGNTRVINFYRTNDPYGFFSNFSRHPVYIKVWPCGWKTGEISTFFFVLICALVLILRSVVKYIRQACVTFLCNLA
jgi:hypothetical protein